MSYTKVQYASFVKRVMAAFLDILVCIFINTILIATIMICLINSKIDFDINNWKFFNVLFIIMVISTLIILVSYFSIMESSKYKGGVGKLAMKLSVLDNRGSRLKFKKSLVRALFKVITIGLIFGYLPILFTAKKQAYYDIFINTCVVENS